MQPKMPFASLAFLLALSVLVPTAALGEEGEFYVNTYRSIGSISPLGVKEMAMGRSGVGLADGVASLGQNPAALGAMQGAGMDASLGFDWLADDGDGTTQFTFKLGGAVNLDRWSKRSCNNQAIGGLVYSEGFSGAGPGTMDMKRQQLGVLGGYGIHLLDNMLVGVSVALFDGKWSSRDFTYPSSQTAVKAMDRKFIGGDFKVGGLYRLRDETTLGATVGFATGSYKDGAEYANAATASGTLQRFSISGGVAHQLGEETLLLGDLWFKRMQSDIPSILKESDNSWGISAGVEQQVIPDMLALRGGLYYDHTAYSSSTSNAANLFVPGGNYSKGRAGFTAGVGVKLYGWDMGYGLDINTGGEVKNMLDVKKEW